VTVGAERGCVRGKSRNLYDIFHLIRSIHSSFTFPMAQESNFRATNSPLRPNEA
jgi:hypothetical protein